MLIESSEQEITAAALRNALDVIIRHMHDPNAQIHGYDSIVHEYHNDDPPFFLAVAFGDLAKVLDTRVQDAEQTNNNQPIN